MSIGKNERKEQTKKSTSAFIFLGEFTGGDRTDRSTPRDVLENHRRRSTKARDSPGTAARRALPAALRGARAPWSSSSPSKAITSPDPGTRERGLPHDRTTPGASPGYPGDACTACSIGGLRWLGEPPRATMRRARREPVIELAGPARPFTG